MNATMKNWAKTGIIFCVGSLLFSCATGPLAFGVLATIVVDTSGYSAKVIEASKKELVEYVQSLGLEEYEFDPQRIDRIYGNAPKPEYRRFVLKKKNRGFLGSRSYNYNIHCDPNRIAIMIRDNNRVYPNSAEMKKEIDDLLALLRKYYKETDINFELYPTFLA